MRRTDRLDTIIKYIFNNIYDFTDFAMTLRKYYDRVNFFLSPFERREAISSKTRAWPVHVELWIMPWSVYLICDRNLFSGQATVSRISTFIYFPTETIANGSHLIYQKPR